jgi:hypothetical protein
MDKTGRTSKPYPAEKGNFPDEGVEVLAMCQAAGRRYGWTLPQNGPDSVAVNPP